MRVAFLSGRGSASGSIPVVGRIKERFHLLDSQALDESID
jgi:hypothetical protein